MSINNVIIPSDDINNRMVGNTASKILRLEFDIASHDTDFQLWQTPYLFKKYSPDNLFCTIRQLTYPPGNMG